jgi:hypothetical protein
VLGKVSRLHRQLDVASCVNSHGKLTELLARSEPLSCHDSSMTVTEGVL